MAFPLCYEDVMHILAVMDLPEDLSLTHLEPPKQAPCETYGPRLPDCRLLPSGTWPPDSLELSHLL